MTIIYRPTRHDELETIDALVVASINDLTRRHGFGDMASPAPPRFSHFSLQDDVRGLWTAEQNGEPLGFAFSWACEDFWFLAQLFVKPNLQSKGAGQALLRRALEHADAVGAAQRALITFAFNTVSQGLYIRHGFAPRFPIYAMIGRREELRAAASGMFEAAQVKESEIGQLADVDRKALGFSREKHHRFLAAEPGMRLFGLHAGGRLVAYAYVSGSGHIGPLAAASPDLLGAAFETALSLAAEGATENVSCFLPGANDRVLRTAMGHGLRIRFPMLLMSTEDPGDWSCYLPRNPGFM